ncbi:DUF1127 domain-containing protein [Stutzerimonas urumqiensis]
MTARTSSLSVIGQASRQLLRHGWRQVARWRELAAQRYRLAQLDDVALKDLGLSRADVMLESERPFWDDPRTEPRRAQRASAGWLDPRGWHMPGLRRR